MRVGAQAAHPFPSLQAFLSVHFSPEMPPVFLMAFLPCHQQLAFTAFLLQHAH